MSYAELRGSALKKSISAFSNSQVTSVVSHSFDRNGGRVWQVGDVAARAEGADHQVSGCLRAFVRVLGVGG